MESSVNNSSRICFTAADILAQDDYALSTSVVDIALEKSHNCLEKMTASIAIILAQELMLAVKTEYPESNIPAITAQVAFELSNTIEPLLIALLSFSELPKDLLPSIEVNPFLRSLSRTGGPEFAETTVNLTKNGIFFLHERPNQQPNLRATSLVGGLGLKSLSRLKKFTDLSDFSRRIRRQVVLQMGDVPQDLQLRERTGKKIAVITLGLRFADIKNLDWVAEFRNKVVIDFLDFPGIPATITTQMPQLGDASWADGVISSCLTRSDLDGIQTNFFENFRNFSYLQEQILRFANEAITWHRIAEFTAERLKRQKVEVAVTGHGLLIREKLMQIAIQNRDISVISIAHSGIDDSCNYVSNYPANLLLGWGSIDEQILRDQHFDPIDYKSGVKKPVNTQVRIRPTFDGSKILVFLSPGQTGTTFIRVGPRQSIEAIRNLFTMISEHETLYFGLRFHPNYLDKALIDWVFENKPANCWLVNGLLTEVLQENDFALGFSLQMITTAIIDLASHGIPVRHVLQGVNLRENVRKSISSIELTNLDELNQLLKTLASSHYEGEVDNPTMTLLKNTFSGEIGELPEIESSLDQIKKTHFGGSYENEELEYIFWVSSRFPKNAYRIQWVQRPVIFRILTGAFKFPRYTALRLIQAGLLFFYMAPKRIKSYQDG